ncbi:hypothetical protein ACFY3U_17475 [Micromonospora sp. NPDC000089]|uniref:hypothetical protein n=1 Tax=unclassified Micromonospora TaxID=2617518 RepID=UPI0036ABC951
MNVRRWSLGLLAAALLVPGLTACKTDSATDDAAAAPTTPADPKTALLASTKEISKGNFTFSMAGGPELNGGGKVHLPSKSAEVTLASEAKSADDLSMKMHLVYIGDDSWVLMDFGNMADSVPTLKAMKGKYQHLDRAKLKNGGELDFDFTDVDPAGSDKLLRTATEIRQTGPGAYAGTLDVTKLTDSDVLDADDVKKMGAKASVVPFTATVDDQGRLSQIAVDVPTAGDVKAYTMVVKYADYGAATPVQQPPAAKVVEASDQVYQMFNS